MLGTPGQIRTADLLIRRQSHQPLPRILNLSYPRVSVFPEGEEFLVLLFLLIHRKVHLAQQFLEPRVRA